MAVERIIGIDFGTSTSVIRVKRYQDGHPINDRFEVKQLIFEMGNSMVPTLIQKRENGESIYFGHAAKISHKGTKTYANFKVELENADENIRRQAQDLTVEFFKYMAKTYKDQSDGGHLGENSDIERTIISYPVKWSDETKRFMCETAKAAGFPNVEGLDEARAAIQAVTVQYANTLSKKGYFKDGVPVTILLIDMGAGTTDLVLCRHSSGSNSHTEILCTWPQKGDTLFGGKEVDTLLRNMIYKFLPEDSADLILKKIHDEEFKTWKENMVSPALTHRESVEEFSALDNLAKIMDIDLSYSISRDNFEVAAENYLRKFPELINDCLENANVNGNDVDLVILTGGHSQWYFVKEMLLGKMPQFGMISLDKIQKEPDRMISISLPQETVALGLVYGKLASSFSTTLNNQIQYFMNKELLDIIEKELPALLNSIAPIISSEIESIVSDKVHDWKQNKIKTLAEMSDEIKGICNKEAFHRQLSQNKQYTNAVEGWCKDKVSPHISKKLRNICQQCDALDEKIEALISNIDIGKLMNRKGAIIANAVTDTISTVTFSKICVSVTDGIDILANKLSLLIATLIPAFPYLNTFWILTLGRTVFNLIIAGNFDSIPDYAIMIQKTNVPKVMRMVIRNGLLDSKIKKAISSEIVTSIFKQDEIKQELISEIYASLKEPLNKYISKYWT